MSQTTTTAPSINEINAALLAQVKSAQSAKSAGSAASTGEGSFASTLSAVEKVELSAPTPLVGAKTAVAAPAKAAEQDVTKQELLEEEAASCDEPTISRSARMACAEKATAVQESDLGFEDLVDFINPLQHIPIIGSIYRAVTGDAIKPEVQVAGSVAFGLATGSVLLSAATGIASAAYQESTGTEPTVQIADALFGGATVNVPDPMTEKKIVLADAGTVDPSRTVATAKAATTATADKTGLLAKTTASEAGRADLSTHALAQTGGLRVGNTVYASTAQRFAAKLPAATKTATAQKVSSSAQDVQTAQKASANDALQPLTTANASGQSLPPELVHDMMLMALDKYQTASAMKNQTSASVQ